MTATTTETPRHLRRQPAYLNGTDITPYKRDKQIDAIASLDSLYRLSRVNLVGWPLDSTEGRAGALDLLAHNAALNTLGLTDSAVTQTYGMNRTAEDVARINAFHDERDAIRETLRGVARTLGPANLAGRLAWLSAQPGGR